MSQFRLPDLGEGLEEAQVAQWLGGGGRTSLPGTDAGHASPLVRKMAAERGIDLGAIVGTGPGGRIRVEDLEATTRRGAGQAMPPTEATAPAEDEERISTVGLRKAIAARML